MDHKLVAQAWDCSESLNRKAPRGAAIPAAGSGGFPLPDSNAREGRSGESDGADAFTATFRDPMRADSDGRTFFLLMCLMTTAVTAAVFPQFNELLLFDRVGIEKGQLWRLFTCHLAHWSASHLIWNLVVLAAIGWGAKNEPSRSLVTATFGALLLIGPALYLCEADMLQYAGLSGVATALFVCFACERMRSAPGERLLWGAFLIALCGKIAVEFVNPSPLFATSAAIDLRVAPLAHLVGAAAGVWRSRILQSMNNATPSPAPPSNPQSPPDLNMKILLTLALALGAALLVSRTAWILDQKKLGCGTPGRAGVAAFTLGFATLILGLILSSQILRVPGAYGPVQYWGGATAFFEARTATTYALIFGTAPIAIVTAISWLVGLIVKDPAPRVERSATPAAALLLLGAAWVMFFAVEFFPSA